MSYVDVCLSDLFCRCEGCSCVLWLWVISLVCLSIFRCLEIVCSEILNGVVSLFIVVLLCDSCVRIVCCVGLVSVVNVRLS